MTTDTPSAPPSDDLHDLVAAEHRILLMAEELTRLRAELAEAKRERDDYQQAAYAERRRAERAEAARDRFAADLAEADAVIFHFSESAGIEIDVPGCERANARYLERRAKQEEQNRG